MILDESSYLKINEIVRKANDDQVVKLQDWTKENFVSKLECAKLNNKIKNSLVKTMILGLTLITIAIEIISYLKK